MPLHGIRVIACEIVVALPFGTQLLSDFGADVIVVEQATYRDDTSSRWRLRTGRHKRRIALNLRDPRGQDMVRRLVADADVFAENYRPGIMDKYGLGFRDLSQVNPRLVYVSMSGFGHTDFLASPLSSAASYGPVAEAMGGVSAMLGASTHTGNEALALGDITSSLFATIGTLIALRDRDRTGLGQYIDISMADSLLALSERSVVMDSLRQIASQGSSDAAAGQLPSGFGSFDLNACDGRYVIAMLNGSRTGNWVGFCKLLGHPEWIEDTGLTDPASAKKTFERTVLPVLNEWAGIRSKADVADTFQRLGIPAAPVLTPGEIVQDPHFLARRMITDLIDEYGNSVKVAGNPIKLSRVELERPESEELRIVRPAENTDSVLAGLLGMSSEEIAELVEAGVIGR
jgi:formyl-CoA transferase